MQKKAILILILGLLLAPTFATTEPRLPEPVKAAPVVEVVEKPKETFKEKWSKLSYDEKVEWNPNDCNLTTEILYNSDGSCHPKPVDIPTPAPSGDWVERCYRWAKEGNIPLNSWAIKLLERESHCNPTARNPTSSAGGIPQALPWTKMGCKLSWDDKDAICQLKWFRTYVLSRYGSYEAAYNFQISNNWY